MVKATRADCGVCDKKNMTFNVFVKHLTETHFSAPAEPHEHRVVAAITDRYRKGYFKVVSIRADVTGKQVASYVQEWIDCGCGHLAQTDLKGVRTVGEHMTGGAFHFDFDMGTTSHLVVTVLGNYPRSPVFADRIHLLGQNKLPEQKCGCGNKGTLYCGECARGGEYEGDMSGFYCESCQDEHDCNSDLRPLDEVADHINTPRFGMCGYY
eukprot:TRINITY_DN1268_c0_g1_i1.p1 TRINITY_DN1268_c0_g1~~TRINITY_DN1268_c0_g1_i1.p1  ORF type:complete len:210 (-),score=21.21 TRINITY_DN1268_c0_g1_i1:116-745(-)